MSSPFRILRKKERELKEMVRNRGGEYPAAQVRL